MIDYPKELPKPPESGAISLESLDDFFHMVDAGSIEGTTYDMRVDAWNALGGTPEEKIHIAGSMRLHISKAVMADRIKIAVYQARKQVNALNDKIA